MALRMKREMSRCHMPMRSSRESGLLVRSHPQKEGKWWDHLVVKRG
jgi:hypothetical protein